jgi:tRNA pseudouridine38-40 synthase
MQQAAQSLLGLRDFATFCKARPHGTTIRELQQLSITALGDEVVIAVAADAFCHSMVRSLVGVLTAVGEGRKPVDEPARMLAARRRTGAVHTAAACGLTLVQVDYPADDALAARASMTRAVRSSSELTGNDDEGRR